VEKMKKHFAGQNLEYDGRQLSSLWAFKNFHLQGDSIVAFQGPCRVALTEMVDLADVKAQAHIYSEEMLHFIVEHFEMDLEKTIIRQRILVCLVKELLDVYSPQFALQRKGDDLYWQDRKLSVSISTLSPVSTLIHLGLNISSKNTPVPTIGLNELGLASIEDFAQQVLNNYTAEMQSIYLARCKVRGVQ